MIVRRAAPGEGGIVASFIRASLPAFVRPLTIWHSPAVENYVESRLRAERGQSSRHGFYLLSTETGESVGVAEFRRVEQSAFLNYIYVSPGHRGRALGRWLFSEAARDFLRAATASTVMLDVEPGNHLAYHWYRRLGFGLVCDIFYQTKPLGHTHARPGVVTGWDDAEAMHRRFGFSSFYVRTDHGSYSIGRLGEQYFRLHGTQPWSDSGLRAALNKLEPSRRILLLSHKPLTNSNVVWHAQRLRVDSRSLVNSLSASQTSQPPGLISRSL